MPEISPGSITLADIFNLLSGMRTDIARALERIAAIDERNRNADLSILGVRDAVTRADRRISMLEAYRWRVSGAVALLTLLVTVFGTVLIAHLHLLCKRYVVARSVPALGE